MPSGGRRSGAGRKPGAHMTKTACIAARLSEEGATPLELMLAVMRDETQPMNVRLDCAKSAAPFVHPRLAHIQQTIRKTDALDKLMEQIRADDAAKATGCAAPMIIDQVPQVAAPL